MGTLYDIEVETLESRAAVLRVRPTQPDCCPFYTSKRFALALLVDAPARPILTRSATARAELLLRGWAYAVTRDQRIFNTEVGRKFQVASHPLREALPQQVWEDVGSADVDASAFIDSVELLNCSTPRWDYGQDEPVARYRITVTAPTWFDHLRADAGPFRTPTTTAWTSVAYDDDGPYLNLTEPIERGPVLGDIARSGVVSDEDFLRLFG